MRYIAGVNKDSIYTDSTDTEVRLLEVEATVTDDKDQTIAVNFFILGWYFCTS